MPRSKDSHIEKLQDSVKNSVKGVEDKVKTFSSVLQKGMETQRIDVQKSVTDVQNSVSSAFNTKRVGDVVKHAVEQDERGKNVVIFGVPNSGLLQTGKGAVWPVKVTSNSSVAAEEIKSAEGCARECTENSK